MSYAPATLLALRTYLQPRTGLSTGALGIVGDAAHQKRQSYHNGRDAIIRWGRNSFTDYSIRTNRDRAGLTNAASALDIGTPTPAKGGRAHLRALSVWLVAEARRNAPGTVDIREIIYSPDGRTVLRWDRERGYRSAPRAGEADSTHLWHTHVSWYRDSERRSAGKRDLFRRYYEPEDIPVFRAVVKGATMTYNSRNEPRGLISGLTVLTADRVKMDGEWRYRIVASSTGGASKYQGRYLPAAPTVEYHRL